MYQKKGIHSVTLIYSACFALMIFILSSCSNAGPVDQTASASDSLTEEEKHLPENALKGLEIAEGLEVKAMAVEPMLRNPTNIDVDERGRVWVTEAYNYRPGINGNPTNPEGDRIMILEDTNGDAVMDTGKIFYQGPEINAPLGVCVLGNRVLVSQSPYIWAFYDDNGDDKADRKEILFQGIGGEQHDHGAHTFVFGPDGKLYFNFGNEGKTLKDKNGNSVRDQDGDIIGPGKYRQGMVFRCDPDGKNVECLGNNFRNNYEVAIDSYGGMWQSDNDDDGNRGVRINYVMDYGNYGYTDEMTGAGWQASRTNREDSVPFRHWHLNDPGVVPNLLQTGAGSPTGMVIYEGSLLPMPFRNQIIHCDPGPNVVRSYAVTKKGAGYTAEINNVLSGKDDQWFRPADICVAPDGSLIVADWYDPGVGGHQAGDQQRGRIYRIAPPGSKYQFAKYDYTTPAGAILALQNPNLAVRHHAWTALQSFGKKAVPELDKMWRTHADPRMRARAFWVLVKMPKGEGYISQAIKDGDPDIRMMGLRAARQLRINAIPLVAQLVKDNDAQVRRESAISLRHNSSREAPALWTELALQHDGQDRWYLEALGISADRQWENFLRAYLAKEPDPLRSAASRDIIWRARTQAAIPYLGKLASDPKISLTDRLRYFRAFDFNSGPLKSTVLLSIIDSNKTNDVAINKLVLRHLDPATVKRSPVAQAALTSALDDVKGTLEFVELVKKYNVDSQGPALLQLTLNSEDKNIQTQALSTFLGLDGRERVVSFLNENDTTRATTLVNVLGNIGNSQSLQILESTAFSKDVPEYLRVKAARAIGGSWNGEERVLTLLKQKKVPTDLIRPLADGVQHAWRKQVRTEAMSYVPGTKTVENKEAPAAMDILALKGEPENGRKVFQNMCGMCHRVKGQGIDFGPDLSAIGAKLPREALLEAVLQPSAGISFGYEGWELDMNDGSKMYGIIASKTETDIDLKLPGGTKQALKTSDVKSLKQVKESMMPEGLHQAMSKQELADVIAYMNSLK